MPHEAIASSLAMRIYNRTCDVKECVDPKNLKDQC